MEREERHAAYGSERERDAVQADIDGAHRRNIGAVHGDWIASFERAECERWN